MYLQKGRLLSEERRQNRDMLRSKGEELFTLLDSYESGFKQCLGTMAEDLVASGVLKPDRYSFVETRDALRRIQMFTRIYFPPLSPFWIHSQNLMTRSHHSLKESWKIKDTSRTSPLAGFLVLSSGEVDERCAKLQQEVIRLLQNIHSETLRKYGETQKPTTMR
jgi:hypothetical protein